MGNRAVITQRCTDSAPAIYLHWNGGRASVEAFLEAARIVGLDLDSPTIMDDLADLIARRFFGGKVGYTVYRFKYGECDTDNGDNGVYLIDRDLKIIGRNWNGPFEEINPEKTRGMIAQIIDNLLPKCSVDRVAS